ncbi:class I SAM-dependent methyltransferase [Flavobacterium sp. GT3P67]|uniref:class I SAM-dependent methyltransferase n=1 Tax=Flavobacterium sp. GT3P67 TaxID=2541722 RepID=UPI00104CD97D|nr:class I SAM-dependent methyltransferase [Flavobacterium sp. GT3P67]TDE53947.1 class I SAM-dependent methyltransferase [Flavobacterium sp. GT3P67]
MTPIDYNDNFHEVHFQNSIDSANEIVPLFLSYFKPKTVLDIGCGLGTWLKIFEQNQCEVFGIDGDYVKIKDLVIDQNKFKSYDLNLPYNLERKFDLAISLEVAEHVYPKNAKAFIDSICLHSDIVLFSAALPGQEGTMHFNEQYNEYWTDLFSQKGYQCIDFLRHKIWNNQKISWWYRQNILIFIKKTEIDKSKFNFITREKINNLNSYVHPDLFEYKCQKADRLERILNNPLEILKYYLRDKKIF